MEKTYDNQGETIKKEETEKQTDKKCEKCGAVLRFDPKTGTLLCDYCNSHFELPETRVYIEKKPLGSATNVGSKEWGAAKKAVECKSCGAVSIYDDLEIASICPFCGSTQVMPAANENTIAPDGICPFKITKEEAGLKFTKWLKRKLFAPKKAKQSAKPEGFKGMYIPYWNFDSDTTSDYTASAGYDKKRKKKDGTWETYTEWENVNGVYHELFIDEAVMASKRMNDSGVKKCEPFELDKAMAYDPRVLAGFIAERYSTGLKEGWGIAKSSMSSKLSRNIERHIKSHWHCDQVCSLNFQTMYKDNKYNYVMVPVWISSFQYNGKTYQFAVNGQTGKVGGKSPISVIKVIIACVIGAIILLIIAGGVSLLDIVSGG